MKRFLSHIWHGCRNERGAVTPILMMMSGILFLSGMAFLGAGVLQVKSLSGVTAGLQAQYNAEQAIRIALWRMNATNPPDWSGWANFDDTTRAAVYDPATLTVTGIGKFAGVTDSVRTHVKVDTITAKMYLAHVILYKTHLDLGPDGQVNYPFEQNAPYKMRGWKNNKMKYKHLVGKSGKFIDSQKSKKGKSWKEKKVDLLHTYNGNQTFDGPMEDGVHFVNGNVHLHNGVVLHGSIVATGHVTFAGRVEINAMKFLMPSDYDHKSSKTPAMPDSMYLPAVIAIRGSDADQDIDDDAEDMMLDAQHPLALDIRINGMLFSTRKIHLEHLTLNGSIVAKEVFLEGAYNVTFAPEYITPPPPYVEVITGYEPRLTAWRSQ